MIPWKAWVAIGALIWAVGAPTALWILYDHERKAVASEHAKVIEANSRADAAENAVKVETKIQTVTRTVYVKAQQEADNVQKVDPKCANGDAFVSSFRSGIERLRGTSEADNSASISTTTVQGGGPVAGQNGQ